MAKLLHAHSARLLSVLMQKQLIVDQLRFSFIRSRYLGTICICRFEYRCTSYLLVGILVTERLDLFGVDAKCTHLLHLSWKHFFQWTSKTVYRDFLEDIECNSRNAQCIVSIHKFFKGLEQMNDYHCTYYHTSYDRY